jgi:hypothetical protein
MGDAVPIPTAPPTRTNDDVPTLKPPPTKVVVPITVSVSVAARTSKTVTV